MKNYFRHEKLSDRVYRIISIAEEMQYLVIGSKKAVLFDTGTGVGNIADYVKTLTDRPLEVYLTHGHCDHAGGAGCFERVYLSEDDFELFKEHSTLQIRQEFVEMSLREEGEREFPPTLDYVDNRQVELCPLSVGDEIDLGDIHFKVISGKGHTKGSLCFLDEEHKEIFLGDAINGRMFLFLPECTSVREYLSTLIRFDEIKSEMDHMYIFHHPGEITEDYIRNTIEICEDILRQKTDDIPFEFLGHQGYFAKATDAQGNRLDGKVGNIVYSKDKVG